MLRVLSVLLFFSGVGYGQQSYKLVAENGRVNVVSSVLDLNAVIDKSTKLPECKKLYKDLNFIKTRIQVCLRNDRDENSCYLLKSKLYKLLWDQDLAAFDFTKPSFIAADLNLSSELTVDAAQVSRNHGIDVRDIHLVEENDLQFDTRDFQFSSHNSDWLTLISKLQLNKDPNQFIYSEKGLQINRLQFCEIVENKLDVSQTNSSEVEIQTYASDKIVDHYFEYLELVREKSLKIQKDDPSKYHLMLGGLLQGEIEQEVDFRVILLSLIHI